ncbi:MAG TPA: hypothetical protein ENL03_04560, partial [Phycisphaerae bacterium]|nr:hypothetical protein [Phycisphaerae bacterium]
MWPFKKQVKQRRLEIRKRIPTSQDGWWRNFRNAGGLGSALLGLALLAGLIATDMLIARDKPYHPDQYVPNDIHARLDFEITRSDDGKETIDKYAEGAVLAKSSQKWLDDGIVGLRASEVDLLRHEARAYR